MNVDEGVARLRSLGEGIRLDPSSRLAARVVLAELHRLRGIEQRAQAMARGSHVHRLRGIEQRAQAMARDSHPHHRAALLILGEPS